VRQAHGWGAVPMSHLAGVIRYDGI
jgi:hypothetical protein